MWQNTSNWLQTSEVTVFIYGTSVADPALLAVAHQFELCMVSSRKQAEIKGQGGQLSSVTLDSSHYSNMSPDFILNKSFKTLTTDIISCVSELKHVSLTFYISIYQSACHDCSIHQSI